MKKEIIKKVLVGLVILLVFMLAGMNAKKTLQQRERETMIQYIECLKENFTQRDYCAKKLHESYTFLDRKLADYGYYYTTDGVNLYIHQLGGTNE